MSHIKRRRRIFQSGPNRRRPFVDSFGRRRLRRASSSLPSPSPKVQGDDGDIHG